MPCSGCQIEKYKKYLYKSGKRLSYGNYEVKWVLDLIPDKTFLLMNI